jgi:PIN domain nuclease of toxin-antitoxin system
MTFWEISMLARKGRVELSDPFPIWMKNVIQRSKVEILGVIPEIIEAVYNLPGEFHGDPADRIIAATSLAHKIKLATTDGNMTAYKFLDIL